MKASGPDGVSGHAIRNCARQHAVPYTAVFQKSLNETRVPKTWKDAVIIPIPKNARPAANNDFRPIALTSIVMKCFERMVLRFLIHPIRRTRGHFPICISIPPIRLGRNADVHSLACPTHRYCEMLRKGAFCRFLVSVQYDSATRTDRQTQTFASKTNTKSYSMDCRLFAL